MVTKGGGGVREIERLWSPEVVVESQTDNGHQIQNSISLNADILEIYCKVW